MATASNRALQAIRGLIADGSYRAGQRLPAERVLAEHLGTSRSTIREALRTLELGGVLNIQRNSGSYVAPLDIGGLFEVLISLQPLAAKRTAERLTNRTVERLASIHDLPTRIDDLGVFVEMTTELHREIARASGNDVLANSIGSLMQPMSIGLTRALTTTSARAEALDTLERTIASIERGWPARAANAMERHLLRICAQAELASKGDPHVIA